MKHIVRTAFYSARKPHEGHGMVRGTGPHCHQDDQLGCNLFNLLLRFLLLCLLVYLTCNLTRLCIRCINGVTHLKLFLQVLPNTRRNHLSSFCCLLLQVLGDKDTKTCRLYANSWFRNAKRNFKMRSNFN